MENNVLQCIFVYYISIMATNQDNKTDTIIVRVNPELKADLKKMADMDSRKLGDFVRVQLVKLVETSKKKK